MAYRHDENEQAVILNTIDDAIVTDAKAKMALLAALERLDPVWSRIFSQEVDLVADPLAKIARKRLNGP